MEILQFIFRNFWTFIGSWILIGLVLNIVLKFIIYLVHGHKPSNYKDHELIAIYKLGKMDGKNGNHLDEEHILSEIRAFVKNLKNGNKTTGIRK